MRPRYRTSISNKIFFVFVATFIVALIVMNVAPPVADVPHGCDPEAYQVGYKVGYYVGFIAVNLIILLFIPLLFSWAFWYLSGKRVAVGSWVFNILLVLILGNHLLQLECLARKTVTATEMEQDYQQAVQTFKTSLGDTPDTTQAAYGQFTDSVEQTFDKQAGKSTTASEKKFYAILKDYVAQKSAETNEWWKSFHALQAKGVLNYSLLTSNEKFEQQKQVVTDYIDKSKKQKERFANIIPSMKKRLSVLGENHPLVVGAMQGAAEKHDLQKPIFEPLIETHIDYGNGMLEILNLLQKNRGQWTCDNGQLMFQSNVLLSQYNQILQRLIEDEKRIDALAPKLLQTL